MIVTMFLLKQTMNCNTSEQPPHCQFRVFFLTLKSQEHSFSSPFEHDLVTAHATEAEDTAYMYAASRLSI